MHSFFCNLYFVSLENDLSNVAISPYGVLCCELIMEQKYYTYMLIEI